MAHFIAEKHISVKFTSSYNKLIADSISRLIVLPHTVFALPFALSAFVLAWQLSPSLRWPMFLEKLALIILAVFMARTAAMGFNRIIDATIDKKNPRTSQREIPSGVVKKWQALVLVLAASASFFGASFFLGRHCLILAPAVLAILFFYSLTKRFTALSHLFLGLCLAAAPGGAWWVLRPHVEPVPLVLMMAVCFWVTGFDILYSCQDIEFDRANKLFSIPAKLGLERAFMLSRMFHIVSFVGFIFVGLLAQLSSVYFAGMIVLGLLFVGQHMIVSPANLSRINHSFFTFNGILSVVYFLLVCVGAPN